MKTRSNLRCIREGTEHGKGVEPRSPAGYGGHVLNAWCIREPSAWILADSLFGAYEVFCRHHRRKDLTFGEFADQMEIEGCQMQQRYGAGVFNGLSLTYMEDAFISRHYGARPGKS